MQNNNEGRITTQKVRCHLFHYLLIWSKLSQNLASKPGRSKMATRVRKQKPFHDSKTSLRSWRHTWVTLTASSQNNNLHHTRCRKKFKDWPKNQPLIAPNSCDLLYSQQSRATTAAGSKPAWETFYRTNRWAPCIMCNSPSHPQDKPAQHLGRLIPPKNTE
jgi:hypothetical protein